MKKMLKNKKIWIITSAVVVFSALVITVSMLLWKKPGVPKQNVTFYGFSSQINYNDYLPEEQAKKLIDSGNGIAFNVDSLKYYQNGEFKEHGACVVFKDNDTLKINAAALSEAVGKTVSGDVVSIEAAAKAISKEYVIYENKLVVFTDDANLVKPFENYYTLEMMSMRLRDVAEEDIKNALIDLPDRVTNGSDISVNYTDPDLELGLQTQLYNLQVGNDISTSEAPRIVAGEGAHKDNHTVVRVFNEYQSKISQFLAFPANVTGGVKVAGASVSDGGTERNLIATAAYNGNFTGSKSVRVFDEYGMLYMEIVPSFAANAPYNIAVGDFLGDEAEELFISAAVASNDGSVPYAVYSLSDGKRLLEASFQVVISIAEDDEDTLNTVISIDKSKGKKDSVLLYFTDKNVTYVCSPADSVAEKLGITMPSNTNGIYASAFEDRGFVFTLNKDSQNPNKSYIRLYSSTELFGSLVDVGKYENMFFYNAPTLENGKIPADSEHIKRAPLRQLRTDLSSGIFKNTLNVNGLGELPYSAWLTGIEDASGYSLGYSFWEPCFTHRWNTNDYTKLLYDYVDENGEYLFAALDKNNSRVEYNDDESSYYVGTYAEGIIELDKLRVYPLRDFLNKLSAEFDKNPELLAGLEPLHEVEINVGDSVGDYNVNMIEGFRAYLLERFGSIENINKKFGTSFKTRADIDAPRGSKESNRGAWDICEGKYFDQWCLYQRKVANKRIAEALREALLAGFPPEIITTHSVPEVDAIDSSFGGKNDRISPIDAILTMGTGFGATRYGTWYTDSNNFIVAAKSSGHRGMTISEYNSLNDEFDIANYQMNFIHSTGVKYVNIVNVNEEGALNDLRSIRDFVNRDNKYGLVRPGYTGGTMSSIPVTNNGKTYNVVQIGGMDNKPSLLKSVNEDGSWEGSVYLVPFRTHVVVEDLMLGGNPRGGNVSTTLGELQTGDMVEVDFVGKYSGKDMAKIHIDIYEDGVLNESLSDEFLLTKDSKHYKYVISNQSVLGRVEIKITFECNNYNELTIESLSGTAQRESVIRKYFDDNTAKEHRGGVTFDILDREMICE